MSMTPEEARKAIDAMLRDAPTADGASDAFDAEFDAALAALDEPERLPASNWCKRP